MTLFPWQVTVDGRLLPMVGHIDAEDAAEAQAIVEHDCEWAFPGSKVTVHVWSVVSLLQQVEDSGLCPGGDSGAGRPPPDSGSA